MSEKLSEISGRTASEILRAHKNQDSIVTNIFSIARDMGIGLYTKDFAGIEKKCDMSEGIILGCIIDNEEDNTLTIYVQNKLPDKEFYRYKTDAEKEKILRRRQRFTVAHEIAHACMHLENQHMEFKIDYDDHENIRENNECEIEANIFAGELLVPTEILLDVRKRLLKPSVANLAELFDVSNSVMKARLEYLGLSNTVEGGLR